MKRVLSICAAIAFVCLTSGLVQASDLGASVPAAPAGYVLEADSFADFELVQGANGWTYLGLDLNTIYKELITDSHCPGAFAAWNFSSNGCKPSINSHTMDSFHEAGRNMNAVRRWTSDVEGNAHIAGAIQNNVDASSGGELEVRLNGAVIATATVGGHPAAAVSFEKSVDIAVGDVVDFEMGFAALPVGQLAANLGDFRISVRPDPVIAGLAAIEAKLDNLPAGPQGPQGEAGANGSDGAAGTNGSDGAAGTNGTDGAAGTNGTDGAQGPAGADADCVACADVANGAVNLACLVLGENIPTSFAETEAAALIIVDTLLISTNVCEDACDIGAEIDALINAKMN